MTHRARRGRHRSVATVVALATVLVFFVVDLGVAQVAGAAVVDNGSTAGVTASSGTPAPGGGTVYGYDFTNGRRLRVVVPPSGFDPTTASAHQLQEYGFPPRPGQSSTARSWQHAMASYRYTTSPSAESAARFANATSSGAMVAPSTVTPGSTSDTTNSHWGGYIAGNQAAYTPTYVAVQGAFMTPSFTPDSCTNSEGNWTAGTFWTGLGGWVSNSLIQQGLTWCFGGYMSSSPGWQAFGEAIDNNSNPPGPLCGQTLFVSPGDTTYMNMSYEQSSETAYFYLENEATGQSASCSMYLGNSNGYYDGSTADWISEQPITSSCIWALPDYGAFTYHHAYAQLNSNDAWVTLGSQSNSLIDTGYGEAPAYWSQYTDALSTNTSFLQNWSNYFYTGSLSACGTPT
ncbi:MAG: G1 family glutamic endopeptidase [Acidimicrobiales bacterium]